MGCPGAGDAVRLACIVARKRPGSKWFIVRGCFSSAKVVNEVARIRVNFGSALPDEQVIRLPRRFTRGRPFSFALLEAAHGGLP